MTEKSSDAENEVRERIRVMGNALATPDAYNTEGWSERANLALERLVLAYEAELQRVERERDELVERVKRIEIRYADEWVAKWLAASAETPEEPAE